jgi:hypothetical protein
MNRPTEHEALRNIIREERIAALKKEVESARIYLEKNACKLSPYEIRDILSPLEMKYKNEVHSRVLQRI